MTGVSFPFSLHFLTKRRDYARQLPRWWENEKGDISGGNQQCARAIAHAIISILFPRIGRAGPKDFSRGRKEALAEAGCRGERGSGEKEGEGKGRMRP